MDIKNKLKIAGAAGLAFLVGYMPLKANIRKNDLWMVPHDPNLIYPGDLFKVPADSNMKYLGGLLEIPDRDEKVDLRELGDIILKEHGVKRSKPNGLPGVLNIYKKENITLFIKNILPETKEYQNKSICNFYYPCLLDLSIIIEVYDKNVNNKFDSEDLMKICIEEKKIKFKEKFLEDNKNRTIYQTKIKANEPNFVSKEFYDSILWILKH